ncbi:MAG: site-specific DNA-methyltransferase [Bacteroidales bacterium]|jgi:site-specific DNA-methyltransferase (adenine-specific)|nr:site-specific DNA-methyltransferase [Bacteroidales bacterium]
MPQTSSATSTHTHTHTHTHQTELNKKNLKKTQAKYINVNTFNCGDFHEVMLKIKPQTVDCIFTSPPYNVGKKYDNHDDNKIYTKYLNFLNEA